MTAYLWPIFQRRYVFIVVQMISNSLEPVAREIQLFCDNAKFNMIGRQTLNAFSGYPCPQAQPEISGKGPGSISVYFLLTITSQNFEESIRLQNKTTWNVIPSHAHEARSADYAIWYSSSSVSPTYVRQWYRVYRRSVDDRNRRALFTHTGYRCDRLLALPYQSTRRPQPSHIVYSTSTIRLIITSRQLKVQFV